MSREQLIPVTSEILEPVYKVAEKLPFDAVRNKLLLQTATLVFMSQIVRVVYGISYSKKDKEYILFLNFDGVEHMSKHANLAEVFTAYGLNFDDFRCINLADLEREFTDYHGKEAAKARTNER